MENTKPLTYIGHPERRPQSRSDGLFRRHPIVAGSLTGFEHLPGQSAEEFCNASSIRAPVRNRIRYKHSFCMSYSIVRSG
jgi:hypothetical protein